MEKSLQKLEQIKLKDYYKSTFPDDDLGNEIDSSATFEDLFNALDNYKNVYELIGVQDSIIRERLFGQLADIIGMPYSYIYGQWLSKS